MTVTSGYVGTELVTAFTYEGMDAGLNHYYFKGKTYAGVVKFDYVVASEKLEA
jgi:hypothetical protein